MTPSNNAMSWTLLITLSESSFEELESGAARLGSDTDPLTFVLCHALGELNEIRSASGDPHAYLMQLGSADIGMCELCGSYPGSFVWVISADDIPHAAAVMDDILGDQTVIERLSADAGHPVLCVEAPTPPGVLRPDEAEPLPLAAVSYAQVIRTLAQRASPAACILIAGTAVPPPVH